MSPASPSFDPFAQTGQSFVASLDDTALDSLHLRLCEQRPGALIRRLRGDRCADERAFFDEAAAALQLPLYSGHNWNAFEESISQYWLPADAILILVAGAQHLFSQSAPSLATLSRIFASGLSPTASPAGQSPSPRPLNLLYQTSPSDHAAFTQRLISSGIRFKTV